ncbi:MAG: S8 family serine peptidase [Actinomycetota bacterium]|nr:S8 family serine peptidase [Actinomycetota bacterium]
MRRRTLLGALCAVLLVLLLPVAGSARPGSAQPQDRNGNKIFDDLERKIVSLSAGDSVEAIVLFEGGNSGGQIAAARSAVGPFRTIYEYETMPGVAGEFTIGQIRALAARDQTLQIQLNAAVDFHMDTARTSYGVDRAVADFGHDGNNESGACPALKTYCKDDVVVAVIDSGIHYGHPDLDGGKVLGGINCTYGECSSLYTYADGSGHGTASAGIIAGEGEVSPQHRGVAPGAGLVSVKVGSSGTTVAALDAAIEWTIANRDTYGIEVMNMSLGAAGPSDGTESSSRLTNRAAAAGILPVSAAGNRGPDPAGIGFPGSAKYSLTVGGMSEPRDREGSFAPGFSLALSSGRGPTADGRVKPDVLAPSTDVTTTNLSSTYYGMSSGTSVASPFAAGVAALALDANPSLITSGIACASDDTSIECADGVIDASMDMRLKHAITSTAVDWGITGPDNEYGHGRLDAYAVMQNVTGLPGAGGPTNPAHTFFSGTLASGGSVEHSISASTVEFPIAATLIMVDRAAGATTPDFNLELVDPSGAVVAASRLDYNLRQDDFGFIPTATGIYKVRVVAASGSGAYWLDVSYPGTEVAPPNSAPVAPTGLTAAAVSSSQINLSWNDVSEESNYTIERSTDGVGGWSAVGTTPADVTSFANTGLTEQTTYYYRVLASNAAGTSPASNVASATTPAAPITTAPSAPSGLSATAKSSTQIDLAWSDVAGESGYKVERSPNGNSKWAQIGTTGQNVTTFSNTGLRASTTYHYRVMATNAYGTSAPSNTASAQTPSGTTVTPSDDTTAPSTPQGLKATTGKGKVSLSWLASTDTGGSGLKGYMVFRSTSVTGAFSLVASPSSTSWSDGSVTRGKTYWYYVKAVDNAGNESAASTTVSVTA